MTNQPHTLETFLEDTSNRLALAACKNVIQMPGELHNPLWIYGPSGVGKTHLLEAVHDHFHRFLPKGVLFITAEEALNAFLSTIDGPSETWESVLSCDILLLDDLGYLSGKHSSSDLFGGVLAEKIQRRQQVILSSIRPPEELPILWSCLPKHSTFTVEITPPDLQLRLRYAREYLRQNPFDISPDALEYMVENTPTFHRIEGALNTARLWSRLYVRPVTLAWMQNYVLKGKR